MRSHLLCAVLVAAVAVTKVPAEAAGCSFYFAPDQGYPEGRIANLGSAQLCRIIGTDANGFFLACTFSTTRATLVSSPIVPGVEATRQWIDMDGDKVPDYCRFTGDQNNQMITCNLTKAINGVVIGWSDDLTAPEHDWGYPSPREWIPATDASHHGQYCRNIGDQNHPQRLCSTW